MTNENGHQMAGLGMTEEDRFRDFLVRSRSIELKRAEMNRRRVELDALVRAQEEEEPSIKAWLKLQPAARLSTHITTEGGLEIEIGAAVETTEAEKVTVYQGGTRLAKAIAQEDAGEALPGIAAFPPEKRPRGRPKKDEPPAGEPIDTTADLAGEPLTEGEVLELERERANNVERRKAAAARMREGGYDPTAADIQAARAQRAAATTGALAGRLDGPRVEADLKHREETTSNDNPDQTR